MTEPQMRSLAEVTSYCIGSSLFDAAAAVGIPCP
jgi:hypothetical protein